jgi:hypothetical protein
MRFYNSSSSRFFCVCCGREGIPIQRKKGQEREAGHLKKLYCLYCGKECNFCEIKEYSYSYTYQDFLLEFNNGNFSKEGERKLPFGQFKSLLKKEEIHNA